MTDTSKSYTIVNTQALAARAHLRLTIAGKVLPVLIAENNELTRTQPHFRVSREELLKASLDWADDLIKMNAETCGLIP